MGWKGGNDWIDWMDWRDGRDGLGADVTDITDETEGAGDDDTAAGGLRGENSQYFNNDAAGNCEAKPRNTLTL